MSNGDNTAPESQAALGDTIAQNRKIEVPDPSSLPGAPPGFKKTDPDLLRKNLRRIAGSNEAEAVAAMEECAGKGPQLQIDLGSHAPSAEQAAVISTRLKKLRGGKARLLSLLACYEELEDIAQSDAVLFLDAIKEDYDYHVKKNPALADEYQSLSKYFDELSEAIRKGIAQAREKKAAEARAKSEE